MCVYINESRPGKCLKMELAPLDERVNVIVLEASIEIDGIKPGEIPYKIQRKGKDTLYVAEIKRFFTQVKGKQYQRHFNIRTKNKKHFVLVKYINANQSNYNTFWMLQYELLE